jgi:hypothetical protein
VGGSGQTATVFFVKCFRRGCTLLAHSSVSVVSEARRTYPLSAQDAASPSGATLLVNLMDGAA